MKTKVVHCRKQEFDVYIGRPSKWGNPFKLKKGDDRDAVLEKYRAWLLTQPELLAQLDELRGKVLDAGASRTPVTATCLLNLPTQRPQALLFR